MNLGNLVDLFFIYLVILGIVSSFVGFIIMRRFKSHINGFFTLFVLSLILLAFLFQWFQSTADELFMGTIPLIFNQLFAVGLYLIYLIISWFVLKSLNNRRQRILQ